MLYTYINRKGDSPFAQWLVEIEHKEPSVYHKVCSILQHMENHDLPLEPPNVRRMIKRTGNHSLYKIRVGKFRLFFVMKNNNYYLLHTFRKSSQKTPEKEIKQVVREVNEDNYQPANFKVTNGEIIFLK